MCLILDANVVGTVFRGDSPVGQDVFEWLENPRARLVVGGKLYDELAHDGRFERWAEEAGKDGRLRRFPPQQIENEEEALPTRELRSDDPHVIALARVSGARILCSEDRDLWNDFQNGKLVSHPGGKILPMGTNKNARRNRDRLLQRTHLCPNR